MKKFLYQPVKPFIVNQHFGENKACIDLATNKKVISCDGNNPPQGYRSLYGPKGHSGADYHAFHGQPVYCACDGIVEFIDTQEKSGLDVRVTSVIDGVKFRHIYEHLLGYQHQTGTLVKTGDIIGWADNTGYSAGDHLHFELQKWTENGWEPVDPALYMSNVYALDGKLIGHKIAWLQEQVARLAELVADYLRDKK